MQIYIEEGASGEVILISASVPDSSKESCNKWHQFEFPALKNNPLVDFITLLDLNNLDASGTRYWTRGDSDPPNSLNPPNSLSTPLASPNDSKGKVICLLQLNQNPQMNKLSIAGTVLLSGRLTPLVLAGGFLSVAAAVIKNGAVPDFLHGLSALNPATPQGQFLSGTSSDQ